jgi:SAM-dependent methyltransferase
MDNAAVAAFWEANAAEWTRQSRAGFDVYRDALNTPAFLAMLPPIEGLHGLDIGCGEGTNTRQVATRGARMTGVDIAPTFITHAKASEAADPRGIDYHVADAALLPFEAESFDFATAFMSMMDVADQQAALREAFRVVRPGGFFQFSILHPCFVPPVRRNIRDASGEPVAIEIADYFRRTNGDVETWHFSALPKDERAGIEPFHVPRFHRTLSDWVAMCVSVGFAIEALGEPVADEALAAREPIVADTRVAPIFLHVLLRKR